ncbi:MAG: hypothetical protein JXB07_19200 [Anaerolineae bacterium]|nr:hypothetical protein [Anaerolineae bacterium]
MRGLIGLVLHRPLVYGDLSVEENLRFYARMYALKDRDREARIKEMPAMVGLAKHAGDRVSTFSRGRLQIWLTPIPGLPAWQARRIE